MAKKTAFDTFWWKFTAPGTGMSSSVEIKTEQRRIIEYLLTPLLKYQSEALRER
ncbi:MAG: hypothetical protein WCA48_23290 [Pseudomonas gingeri]